MIRPTRRPRALPAPAGALWALFLASLAVPAAQASDLRHHRDLTEAALREMGWRDETAIALVAQYSLATDLGRIPAYTRAALQFGLPTEVDRVADLHALAATAPFNPDGTRGFHFAGLYRFSDIETRWQELEAWSEIAAREIGRTPSLEVRERMRCALLGLVSHAVQDFYCHSNWVGLLDPIAGGGLDPTVLPTWEELVGETSSWRPTHDGFSSASALARLRESDLRRSEADDEGGLQTGRPRTQRWEAEPIPWGHRHKGGREMLAVHSLSLRATMCWLERVEGWIAESSGRSPVELAGR